MERRHFGAELSSLFITRFDVMTYGRTKCHSSDTPKQVGGTRTGVPVFEDLLCGVSAKLSLRKRPRAASAQHNHHHHIITLLQNRAAGSHRPCSSSRSAGQSAGSTSS